MQLALLRLKLNFRAKGQTVNKKDSEEIKKEATILCLMMK